MSFEGKIILITGAASGTGADAALHFAKLGGQIAMVDRNEKLLKEIAQQIKTPKPLPIVADITKDAKQIIDETIKHFKKLDVLVNWADVAAMNTITKIDINDYDDIFNVNVRSLVTLTHFAVPHLEKTKGNVVNISSMASDRPSAGFLVYCMSKAAIDQFTKCIALELGQKGIRVNAINPKFIQTPFLEANHSVKRVTNRSGQDNDTLDAITFLASDKAAFVTGTLLQMDGSRLA